MHVMELNVYWIKPELVKSDHLNINYTEIYLYHIDCQTILLLFFTFSASEYLIFYLLNI